MASNFSHFSDKIYCPTQPQEILGLVSKAVKPHIILHFIHLSWFFMSFGFHLFANHKLN